MRANVGHEEALQVTILDVDFKILEIPALVLGVGVRFAKAY